MTHELWRGSLLTDANQTSGKASGVKIDGARVREIRESLGLTQLYVATAVGVTTDTISRWENGRYPTVKRDNAQRLAAALEVSLDEILEQEPTNKSQTTEPTKQDSHGARLPVKFLIPAIICVFAAVALSVYYVFHHDVSVNFEACRILPSHAAPGQTFPVLVRVKTDSRRSSSFILRENLPRGCVPVKAVPAYTAWDRKSRSLEWICHSQDKEITFFYLGSVKRDIPMNTVLNFSGTVVIRKGKGRSRPVAGQNKLEIKPLHWADTNGDGKIDDEEILTVYEEFGEIKGADFGLDQIEAIWAANGYKWNGKTKKFVIIP